jgi:hypothetical protein
MTIPILGAIVVIAIIGQAGKEELMFGIGTILAGLVIAETSKRFTGRLRRQLP